MKKVFIRFLRHGLIEAEPPENFNKMTPEDKLEWANEVLSQKTDKELIESMADFINPEKNGYFDESPEACAIEVGEGNLIGTTIVSTSIWELYNAPEWKNIVEP